MESSSGLVLDYESPLTRLAAQLKIAEAELLGLTRDLVRRVRERTRPPSTVLER